MDKLKVFYALSILAILALMTSIIQAIVYHPSQDILENGTIIKHSLDERGNSTFIELSIKNKEGEDINYTVKTQGAFPEWNLIVPIEKDGIWGLHWVVEGEKNVSILIFKEGIPQPIENINYYIKKAPQKDGGANSDLV
jgi:hypothetical protein